MNLGTFTAAPNAKRQLASLPIPLVLLSPGLQIVSVNPAAEQFFGQSARRLAGRRLTDLLAFREARMAERLEDSETPVSARELETTLVGVGPRRIDIASAPVADTPGWQLLTIHDNSAIEALGEDSGSPGDSVLRGPEILAHEIKNPLAGIRGAAQLLARKLEGNDRSLTDLIAAEVDRIALLIEQMQVLSGKTAPPLEPCNPHEAIRRAANILKMADGEAGLTISEEFDPSLPPVLGNPDGLVQVLINLISNAREACREAPEPQIVLRTRFSSGLQLRSGKGGSPVRLSAEIRVSDNGPGVPSDMREHIFEPFVTSKKSGQGLGLALVRKLVRDMNGRISHERDEVGGWTHFRIHLPLVEQRPVKRTKAEAVR